MNRGGDDKSHAQDRRFRGEARVPEGAADDQRWLIQDSAERVL